MERMKTGDKRGASEPAHGREWRDSVADLHWYQENERNLERYQGMYIAVQNKKIIASGGSFGEVYEQLRAAGMGVALIVAVPHNVKNPPILIA
jgi:hypothetical protein